MNFTGKGPQDQFDNSFVQQRGIDSLKLANLTANIQIKLDLNHPNPKESLSTYSSSELCIMSLRGAANTLTHISNTLDNTTMASSPPVYALAHSLGLAHHAISFVTPIAPSDAL